MAYQIRKNKLKRQESIIKSNNNWTIPGKVKTIQIVEEVIFTKHELFMNQAPNFNFELDEDQLLKKALEVGYVIEIDDNKYLVDNDYGGNYGKQ